jgi:hypothetical protein
LTPGTAQGNIEHVQLTKAGAHLMTDGLSSPKTSNPGHEFPNRWLYIISAAIGAAYGLAVRLLATSHREILAVMSIGFVFFMPFALGCIAVYIAEIRQPQRVRTWIWLPWLSLLAALGGTLVSFLEGIICVVMLLPIGLLLASLGGIVGGVAARYVRSRKAQSLTMACILILPFMAGPFEKQAFYKWETRNVENVVDIQAPPEVVWQNIERVRAIRHEELPSSWAHAIGFPDPIEATLSHEGVGGVRNASFAGNVFFLETVDVWEPQKRLGFTIAAETDKIPSTTLDEHVRVGGEYFDVLRGEYRLEPLATNVTRLHLSSQHRLSTDFNWYAHLWTDAIMSDLQKRILHVVQQRCQSQAKSK